MPATSERRILFFAKVPMNYALFEPVHRRLAAHPRLRFYFTGKHQGQNDLGRLYAGCDLLGGKTIRNSLARWKRFDLYVTPDYRLAGRRARVKVHLFHGFSIRNFAIQERAREFDKLFLIGPYMKRRFLETGILAPDDPRIEEVGMPKLDALVNGAHDREQVLRSLGLDPSNRTVLFAPTWIEGGCLDTQGHAILRALGKLPLNVIVKLHDNSFDPRKQRFDWAKEIPPLLTRRMVLATGANSNPYLAAADVLVSDASSVANEFLLLDRPLVFFRLPHLESQWPSTDRETWGTRTGVAIDRADELERAILDSLDDPGRLSDVRRAAAADFFYSPGRATDAAVKRLLHLAELEEAAAA